MWSIYKGKTKDNYIFEVVARSDNNSHFQNKDISSVIRQKGESQNGYFRKTYQVVRNVHFSESLACFVFLKHSFLDLPFGRITDELRKNRIPEFVFLSIIKMFVSLFTWIALMNYCYYLL